MCILLFSNAFLMGVNNSKLTNHNLRFKFPYPLQWGPPTFAAGHSFAMMSAVLVSMVEVTLSGTLLRGV